MPTPKIPKRPAPPPGKTRVQRDAAKPPRPKPHSYGQSADGVVPAGAQPRQRHDAEEPAGELMREQGAG